MDMNLPISSIQNNSDQHTVHINILLDGTKNNNSLKEVLRDTFSINDL